MNNELAGILEKIPKLPGIYIMKDGRGEILYIGKAKVLHNRVRSYFQNARNLAPRTRVFIGKVADIKFLTTASETEALILESNFIKKHQPRYNVLLKDDKHYPYLRLTTTEPFPRLEVVRRVKKDGSTYFGPYTMVKEVRETIRLIYRIFPLRQSHDRLEGVPVRRPCLNHQMGRCLAPCAGFVTPEEYSRVVNDVILFLKGRNTELIDSLKEKMRKASEDLRYEEAAALRDKIAAVRTVLDKQKIISTSMEDQDVIGYCQERGTAMVQVLVVRGGKMVGEKIFRMKSQNDMESEETLASFLKQYYAGEVILPAEILLPHPLEDSEVIAAWLSAKRGNRVRVEVPARGKKRNLVTMAEENARFAMRTEMDQGDVATRMLEELQETLQLRNFPGVIEGFDISNISGENAVGSMVYFHNGVPDKAKYRKYKVGGVKGIDDYAMLREVLGRRYHRLLREGAELPGLVLVDGGRGHLNTAMKILEEVGVAGRVDVACIAKGPHRNKAETDEVYLPGHKDPVLFRENSPSRFLLQRIRDESHRFAIGFHRQLRQKNTLRSPLESIRGIGKKRRVQLLKKFGSLDNIRKAPLEELQSIPGITPELAKELKSI
ncbi:MAG: excinuclease ABC subunit C [Nitrospinae bacterium CG11_big_fil_rev_8_21_14_0_20_56_8]|nr:MAG: excinuclease ABC subunit C [Nitrospinae bacterium CG11_big_fil_rev_8_21_14_0_20_56_8]